MSCETLPSGWTESLLREIVVSAVDGPFGSNLKTEHYVSTPGVRVVRLQNIGNGAFDDDDRAWVSERHAARLSRHDARAHDVLVASLGDDNHPVGRACLYPKHLLPGIVKADCFRLRLSSADSVPGFVFRLLCCPSTRRGLSGLSQGVTRDRVNLGNLMKFRVRLPPLPEQRRIAEILDTLDEAIRKTEQVIAKLQQMKQGLLHDLLTRGIDENGELRDPERHPEQFKDTSLGPVPKEWRTLQLTELAANEPGSTTIGPFGSNLKADDYTASGVPVLFVRDVKAGEFVWKSEIYVSYPKSRELESHNVESGDLLATKMGLPPCIAAEYPKWMPRGVITADIIRLRPDNERVDVRWLVRSVNGHEVKRQVRAITGGGTRPKVTLRDFRELRVAMPPLPEQRRIAERIEDVEAYLAKELAGGAKLRAFKQGLMDDLLTGRVRVTVPQAATP